MLRIFKKTKSILNLYSNQADINWLMDCTIKLIRGFMGAIIIMYFPLSVIFFILRILSFDSESDKGELLAIFFFVVWIGGIIISINSQLLGSYMYQQLNSSIFQTICLIGYCLFPINIGTLSIKLLYFAPSLLRLLISLLFSYWSLFCILYLSKLLLEF